MKLHLPSELRRALMACVAAVAVGGSALYAEDVTWTTNGEEILNTFPLTLPEGNITKEGSGTYYISLGSSTSDADTISGTESAYTGNVTINAGAIQLGKGATGGIGSQKYVSGDVLGSTGTIYVNSGASLKLNITQNGTVDMNKAISLNGGTLEANDGNYNFNGGLTLTADSTLKNDWGKTQTISNLSASGYKLTLDQGNESGTINFTGSFAVNELAVDSSMTLNIGTENNVVSSFALNNLSVAGGSTVNIAAGGASTQNISAVSLGSNSVLNMVDGNFNYETLTLTGNATMKQGYNKTVNIASATGADQILTYSLGDRFWGSSTLNFTEALELGGLTVQTTDTNTGRTGVLNVNIQAENSSVGTLTAGQYTTVNVTGSGATIGSLNITGGTVTIGADSSLGSGDMVMTAGELRFSQSTSAVLSNVSGRTVEFTGGTLSSAESGWYTDGVDMTLGGVSVTGSGEGHDIILLGGTTTLVGTITNNMTDSAGFQLKGTLEIDVVADLDTMGEVSYSDGENGYVNANFWVVKSGAEGTNLVITDTVAVNGVDHTVFTDDEEATSDSGFLTTTGGAYISVAGTSGYYYVNSGSVDYAVDSAVASDATTGVVLGGGTLNMTTELNSNARDGIIVESSSAIALAEEVTLQDTSLQVESGSVTLQGSGTYDTTARGTAFTNVITGVTNAESWTGNVRLQEVSFDWDSLGTYGNANSTVTLAGTTGYLAKNGTHSVNVVLENYNGKAGFDATNGASGSSYTFAGSVSGSGNMVRSWSSTGALTFNFTGDVSGWTGNFDLRTNGSGGTTVVFKGNATEINANVNNHDSSTLNLTVENDAAVAVKGNITGGSTNVTYKGAGNKTVSGSNTYTGTTAIEAGSVTVAADNALGTGAVTIAEGAALKVGAKEDGTGYALANSSITAGNGTLTAGEGGATYQNVQIATTGITALGEGNGVIHNATLTVTGDYSITDTTLTSCSIEVGAGTTLTLADNVDLSGTSFSVASGGSLTTSTRNAPALSSTSITIALEADGGLATAATEGVDYGTLTYTSVGTEQLNGMVLTESSSVTITLTGELASILENEGNVALYFEGLTKLASMSRSIKSEDEIFTLTGDEVDAYRIAGVDYATDGTYVYIASQSERTDVVPEPTTATLSLLALAALAARRRRK